MKGFIILLSYYDKNNVERFTVKEEEPRTHSTFMSLFHDILDDIGRFYWACDEAPFASGFATGESDMEFFYSELIEEYENDLEFQIFSPPHSILPKYARWIRDNNTTLLGFHGRPDESLIKRLMEIRMEPRDGKHYFDIVDMFLNNEDGSLWECFARDGHLLDRALESALKVVDRKFILQMDSDDREEFYEVKWSRAMQSLRESDLPG